MERMRALYEAKGYPQDWIDKRMRGIAIRNDLTTEWDDRGAKEGVEYAILTNEISQATFAVGIQREFANTIELTLKRRRVSNKVKMK